jgi:hypothetical protein
VDDRQHDLDRGGIPVTRNLTDSQQRVFSLERSRRAVILHFMALVQSRNREVRGLSIRVAGAAQPHGANLGGAN